MVPFDRSQTTSYSTFKATTYFTKCAFCLLGKDCIFKAKVRIKELTFKTKARTKD